MKEWVNEWMNEWMKEGRKEWMNGWMNESLKLCQKFNKKLSLIPWEAKVSINITKFLYSSEILLPLLLA